MTDDEPIILVIDDDESFRRSTERLIRLAGFKVEAFESAADFLCRKRPEAPACAVLDVRMPGMSGLELQKQLARGGVELPLIFITGHGDIPMSVRAMKAGAVEFLTKPFHEQVLLDAIQEAIKRDRAARAEQSRLAELRGRYNSLTPRECEVMRHVVLGLLNKQTAAKLGTKEKTIKFHRGNIMRKMQAQSLADLVRMAGLLHILVPAS